MKPLTPEQVLRLDAHYELLDRTYWGLRNFAAQQRTAIRLGLAAQTVSIDICLQALAVSASHTWAGIGLILKEPEEHVAAAEPEDPEPEPEKKAVLQ